MWSFVGNKQKKQWLWLALDELTREIVGVYVGDSSAQSAKKHGLRRAARSGIPPVARQCAVCYTDIGKAYQQGTACRERIGKDESH